MTKSKRAQTAAREALWEAIWEARELAAYRAWQAEQTAWMQCGPGFKRTDLEGRTK